MNSLTQILLNFKLRFINLFQVISYKQQACKKSQYKKFQSITKLGHQFKRIKKLSFRFQTTSQLFKNLILINKKQLSTLLILSFTTLFIKLFTANFNTVLIQYFQQSQQSLTHLIISIIILILYKTIFTIIDQFSKYLEMKYGYQSYSAIYYHFLKNKKEITGEILNIIEDDMERVSNLPYTLINFPFQSILIAVLSIMLIFTLKSFSYPVALICLALYLTNCTSGFVIFQLNQKIMKQKDYRLSLNLNKQSPQKIQLARKKQVSLIRNFLLVKVMVKWLTELSFVGIYALVFIFQQKEQKQNQDELYYRLMLLGMLKIPFNSLFMESYYFSLVLNSLKRIINCQIRQKISKSTIGGYEDFIKHNNQIVDNSPQKNGQVRESLQSQKSQNFPQSINSSVIRLSDVSNIYQTQTNNRKISQFEIDLSQKTNSLDLQISSTSSNKATKKRYKQKGQIKISVLINYILKNIHVSLFIACLILSLLTLFTKFYNLKITNSIIHNTLNPFQTIIFILPSFLYTLFYLLITFLFLQVSSNLFKNINSFKLNGEDLNRISGDIQMVDKYVSPSIYEFVIGVFGMVTSIVVSVSFVDSGAVVVMTSILILIIIYLAIYLNRYFMKSRRQIKRTQCKLKSQIIQYYTQHTFQYTNNEVISFSKVQKKWKRINICKNLGIIIQNSYILILNVLVVLIQVICLVICYVSQLDKHSTKLILVFMLQIDLTLSSIFLTTISLQMSLVNFQRCVNFFRNKDAEQQSRQK